MISSLLSIEIRVHVINNGNNEIRGSRVKRDAGGDEKQLIKFAWLNLSSTCPSNVLLASVNDSKKFEL